VNGLYLNGNGSSGSTIQGFTIHSFSADGIKLVSSDNTTLIDNYIGTDVTGMLSSGNAANGIYVYQSDTVYVDNLVGGSTAAERNVVSGNNTFSYNYSVTGIFLTGVGTDNNKVQGNYVGLNVAGDAIISNESHNIHIDNGASNNYIGTDFDGNNDAAEGNYLVGSEYANGVHVSDWTNLGTTGNKIYGNYIGTDATGTEDWGNSYVGVDIANDSMATTVGGVGAHQANIIANNYRRQRQWGQRPSELGSTKHHCYQRRWRDVLLPRRFRPPRFWLHH